MNISCEIIRDLLPLYHDEVCSDDSKALVEEHLEDCKLCKEELRRIDSEISMPHVSPDSDGAKKAISSAWKKAKRKSYVKGIVITALICILLAGAFFGLTQWKIVPVAAEALEVTELSQLPDGSIVFRLLVNDNKNLYFTKYTTTDDGCLYVTPMHSVIETTRKYDIGGFDQYHVFNPLELDKKPQYLGTVRLDNITKIYVGPVDKGTLIWEVGMELPDASEKAEQMLAMN